MPTQSAQDISFMIGVKAHELSKSGLSLDDIQTSCRDLCGQPYDSLVELLEAEIVDSDMTIDRVVSFFPSFWGKPHEKNQFITMARLEDNGSFFPTRTARGSHVDPMPTLPLQLADGSAVAGKQSFWSPSPTAPPKDEDFQSTLEFQLDNTKP